MWRSEGHAKNESPEADSGARRLARSWRHTPRVSRLGRRPPAPHLPDLAVCTRPASDAIGEQGDSLPFAFLQLTSHSDGAPCRAAKSTT